MAHKFGNTLSMILIMMLVMTSHSLANDKDSIGRLLKGASSISPKNHVMHRQSLFEIGEVLTCASRRCQGAERACCLLTECKNIWFVGHRCVPIGVSAIFFSTGTELSSDSTAMSMDLRYGDLSQELDVANSTSAAQEHN